MTTLEQIFFWITVFGYVGSSLFYVYWFTFQKTRGRRWERFFIFTGLISNLVAIIIRTETSGHLPVRSTYELNLVLAALIVIVFLIWERKIAATRLVGMVCLPFAFLVLGGGYVSSPAIKPLTAAYLSPWLVVHVLFALLGTACFVFAAGASVFYLLKSQQPVGQEPGRYASLPSPEVLNDLSFKLVLLGFIGWTVMIISGAIWAKGLWGNYWSWDPVETWSFISWLAYGLYVHLHFTYGWQGRRLAWLCLACLLTNIISTWAVGLVTPATYHNLQQITSPWNRQ